ncbi:MAG: ATP-grasp domain-containing protein, partial [Spirochaetaceae bacterium]|nr:ATP-grasp domain-containing protein [Spirochaetaceae bacterium]
MKIIFYSTNSNHFDCNTFKISSYPTCKEEFEKLVLNFPQHEFFVVTQFPGMFLIDYFEDGKFLKSENVNYYVLNSKDNFDAQSFAKIILDFNPDVAIAFSFWTTPLDWQSLKDSMVAKILEESGVKTFCNSVTTCATCFDKNFTNQKLNELISNKKIGNLKIPKSVYVHHELFWTERNKNEIKENVYKELIFLQIKNLNFPVIIKDTCGVSSYGMEVAITYNQVISFLNSKRNNSDRIIQEYIDGIHFGTEIFSYKNSKEEDNHFVMSPFIFSTNKYGITSPKQSVKLGPINNSIFKIDELKKSLLQLANEFNFCGITQVDLIFKNDFWYLLEINPRLSGMSKLYSVLSEKSLMEIFINLIEENFIQEKFLKNNFAINFKIPLLQKNQFDELSKNPNVKYLNQMENLIAKQEREKGFCQVVLSSKKSFEELKILFEEFIQENERFIDKD